MMLTEIARGRVVTISDLSQVQEGVRRRLLDLGVWEGECISVQRALPSGGPWLLDVKGQWVAIRHQDARAIRVRLHEPEPDSFGQLMERARRQEA